MYNKSIDLKWLILIIIILVMGIMTIIFYNENIHDSIIEEYKKEINVLNEKISKLGNINDSISNSNQKLFGKIKTLDSLLGVNRDSILKINKAYDEQIKNINNMSINDINEFFSNRYQ